MGKTKTAVIDDSVLNEPEKKADKVVVEETKPAKAVKAKSSKQAKKKANLPKARGKKYQEKLTLVDKGKKYPLSEAVKLAQEVSYTKFPGTIEIHLNTNSKNIRGLASLPFASGKKLSILAFGPSTSLRVNNAEHPEELEDVIIGTDETIEEISKGKISFDVLVTTPEWMPKLAKVAKILGPRGLMPNPKSGTITDNLLKTIADLREGKTEYKTEANGQVIHLGIGKASQASEEISANVKALYNVIGRSRISKIVLSPTMGPGVKIDLSSI